MVEKAVVRSFKLGEEGLARVFGELEAQIMEAVWALDEPTVRDVCDYLGEDYHYKTVMTVLNRLVKKKVLTRRRQGRAYAYSPRQSRQEFLKRVSREVMAGLLRDFGSLALAQFVDVVEDVDPEQLEELERLIQERTSEGPTL